MLLHVRERRLQSCVAGGRLELGVCLGDGDDALQRPGERIFFAGACGGTRVTGLQRAAARRDQRFERAALVAGMALHDRHDVGNEIVAPLQLHVDVGPGVVAQLAQPRETIEGEDGPAHDEQSETQGERHGPTLARRRSECEDALGVRG